MTTLVTVEYTNRFNGMWTVKELFEGRKQAIFTGDYKTEKTAKGQVTRRMNFRSQYDHIDNMVLVTPEEMQAEVEKRNAPEEAEQAPAPTVAEPEVESVAAEPTPEQMAELLPFAQDYAQYQQDVKAQHEAELDAATVRPNYDAPDMPALAQASVPEPPHATVALTGMWYESCSRCHMVQTRGRCQGCNLPLCPECAEKGPCVRCERIALQRAWAELQSVPSYLEQCSVAFAQFCEAELARELQAASLIGSDGKPFDNLALRHAFQKRNDEIAAKLDILTSCWDIEDRAVQERLLALNAIREQEERETAEFYRVMTEAQ